ncbi:DUF6220 domain-containing protein [Monashia sp. NPDC004114]
MRKTYIVLAWIIAGGVFVQAAAIAFGFGGMAGFVQDGGVVDKALVESQTASNFTGELGFVVHGIVGGMVIPAAALLLLVVSFFVRTPRARTWAAVLFGLVVVQAMLGYSIVDVPYLGLLHGANALALLLIAVHAARRARVAGAVEAASPSTRVAV